MHDEETVNKSIQGQRKETAETLGIPMDDVYPVSAQKGLLAKIKKDDDLLLKSGLPSLELALSEEKKWHALFLMQWTKTPISD